MEAAGNRHDMAALARLWIVHDSLQAGSALAMLVGQSFPAPNRTTQLVGPASACRNGLIIVGQWRRCAILEH